MGSRRRNAGESPLNGLERLDWELVSLGEITEDPRLQMRLEGLDEKHVRDLMATIEEGKIEDAITLVREGKTLWLADGFHRVEAMRRVATGLKVDWKIQPIKAIVLTGTFDDAKQLARKANLRHGKPLSPASRKAILFDMVRNGEEIGGLPVKRLSNNVLAAELGVHQDTIGEWLKELISTGGNPPVTQADRDIVFDRNGREINVAEIAAANRRRAEEESKRKAHEKLLEEGRRDQERLEALRTLPVIGKVKYIASLIMSSPTNMNLSGRFQEPFTGLSLPDEQKKQGHYRQAANARYSLRTDVEERLNHEMKLTHPYTWYQALLDLPPHIWEQAEREAWDEDEMQAWWASFTKSQQAGPPSNRPTLPGKTAGEIEAEKRQRQFNSRQPITPEIEELDDPADSSYAKGDTAAADEADSYPLNEDNTDSYTPPTPPIYPVTPQPSNGKTASPATDTTISNRAVERYLKAQKPAAELLARWVEARNLEICEHLDPDSQYELQKVFEDVAWAAIDRWAQTLHWAGYQERGFMNAVAELFEKVMQE